MKFLLVTNLYEPFARGGAEGVVKSLALGLKKRGHEVVVLTAGPPRFGLWPKEEVIEGIRVLRFFPFNIFFLGCDSRYPKFVRVIFRLIDVFNLPAAWVLADVLDQEKPDIVMTHNLVGIGLLTPWVIRKKKIKHLHTLHDVQLIHPSGLLIYGEEERAENFLIRGWHEGITRWLFGSPEVVTAPSKWLLNFHLSRGFFPNSKTMVLPNPVDCATISRVPVTRYSLPVTRLLYAGQLEKHKGVMWLLENREQKTGSGVVLEFAGSGTLAKEVKKAAEKNPDKIIFHGKLDQAALFKRLAEVDALVVPSLCYENAPRIISEALCVGLPVIASRLGGIPEMIRDGENGFLFTPRKTEEFAQAILKLKEKKTIPKLVRGLPITTNQYFDRLLEL